MRVFVQVTTLVALQSETVGRTQIKTNQNMLSKLNIYKLVTINHLYNIVKYKFNMILFLNLN